MKTIKSIIDQFTNPETLYNDLLETLRKIDSRFVEEEAQFSDAVTRLKAVLDESEAISLDTYLNAAREEIAAIMVYTGWLGFRLNLDCWKDPIQKLMLDQDYEEITQEHTFGSIPAIKSARMKQEATFKTMLENRQNLFCDINSFFSYLHTVAPKLAHLVGFRLADMFLYHVVPGYCPDTVITHTYTRGLEEYLKTNHIPDRK